jgi:hypothetical protein
MRREQPRARPSGALNPPALTCSGWTGRPRAPKGRSPCAARKQRDRRTRRDGPVVGARRALPARCSLLQHSQPTQPPPPLTGLATRGRPVTHANPRFTPACCRTRLLRKEQRSGPPGRPCSPPFALASFVRPIDGDRDVTAVPHAHAPAAASRPGRCAGAARAHGRRPAWQGPPQLPPTGSNRDIYCRSPSARATGPAVTRRQHTRVEFG